MSGVDVRGCAILVVDDEPANLDLLEEFLRAEGYERIVCLADSRRAVAELEAIDADLVLLDLHMPHLSGLDVLAAIQARSAPDGAPPVLVLTADVTTSAKERALSAGARDFVTKPFDGVEVLLRVRNLLEMRVLHRRERAARRNAEAAADRAALLAEASRALGASLDGATAASHLACRLTPALGEACLVFRSGPEGLEALAMAPETAANAAFAASLASDARLLDSATGAAPRGFETPLGRLLAAPMQAPGGPVGVLAMVRGTEGEWADEERTLLAEIAGRAALALENARLFAAAESARRARERMLSVVAHDLRNPLAAIAMYAEMMLSILPEDGGDGYHADAVRSIFQSAGRMQQLIEDLLDVSSLQQGAFPLRRLEQPLEALLREAEQMLRPLAEAKGIGLTIGIVEPGSIGAIDVDGARLLQVLSNLVGNAVKHTPAGGTVQVLVDRAEEQLRFTVADTGPGIPDDQIHHMFDAFQKGRRERRGVGLGLWIAKAIVEAHGGRIWAEARGGEGAVFRFTIPSAVTAAREVARLWVD